MMVRKTTGLHEKTVQAAEELAGVHAAKRRPRGKQVNSTVRKITVDPRVMETARKLAAGDMSRVRIVDATTVVVENPR